MEETSKMQACKTFSSMHGQAWHFMYKKTIRKGSNMYKNHLHRQRSVWVTLNPNPAAANPCPRPPFTTLLLALLFLETMLPRKSRWLGIVYIQVLYSNEHCTYSSWVWICNLKGFWMFFVSLFVWSGVGFLHTPIILSVSMTPPFLLNRFSRITKPALENSYKCDNSRVQSWKNSIVK